MKADSPACVLKKKYHMTYGICEEAVYHVYCKTRLASRSNFIVFRIFKIGFQLGTTFDPVHVLSDGIIPYGNFKNKRLNTDTAVARVYLGTTSTIST